MTNPEYHFGLLGHNVIYTLSPQVFAAISRIENIPVQFDVIDVPPDRLGGAVNKLRGLDGFSVTVPFKEQFLQETDSTSAIGKQIGAINSVRVIEHKFHGGNTDWIGFSYPFRQSEKGPRSVLILGHGGAARAVLYGLAELFPGSSVLVCGRDHVRASGFAQGMVVQFKGSLKVSACVEGDIRNDDPFDLIVNCTPIGGGKDRTLSPLPESFAFAGEPTCYDLIYSPANTPFLCTAAAAGCVAINGRAMLVRQAVASYAFWTEKKCDEESLTAKVLNDDTCSAGQY